jgi:hypothetical protein
MFSKVAVLFPPAGLFAVVGGAPTGAEPRRSAGQIEAGDIAAGLGADTAAFEANVESDVPGRGMTLARHVAPDAMGDTRYALRRGAEIQLRPSCTGRSSPTVTLYWRSGLI